MPQTTGLSPEQLRFIFLAKAGYEVQYRLRNGEWISSSFNQQRDPNVLIHLLDLDYRIKPTP